MGTKERNQLMKGFDSRANGLLSVFTRFEQGELLLSANFVEALNHQPLQLMAFACLGSRRGREEITPDIMTTILFRRFHRRIDAFIEALQRIDPMTELHIFLPDFEPRRTWGWEGDQSDVTLSCMIMREDVELLPMQKIHLWSEIEEGCGCEEEAYLGVLSRIESLTPSWMFQEEIVFFRELSNRHPDILTRGKPRDIAKHQLAAYAHEGSVLERVFPNAILLQADAPFRRRDAMFAPLRSSPLVIAHPFACETSN
ncbi:MAG: hypothetical protein WC776_02575 [Patescibacteria group bacterium]|jgi:hypothetical protein